MNVFLAQRQDDGDRSVPRPPLLASPSASGNSSSVFHSPRQAESTSDSPLPTPDSRLAETHAAPRPVEADHASRQLFAALPAAADVRILLRESARPSRYTCLTNTLPHSRLTVESLAAPYAAVPPPRPDTHPVLLARLMLLFAITLQSPSAEKTQGLSELPEVLMQRLVAAVRTWVTTREEMHKSLECLICIVLEGVYEINCGNLRHAWSVFRRAMTVAQLMGLQGSGVPCLPRLDPGLDADAKFLWFRIVYTDRYLSLLLGLPQGSTDKSMGDASVVQNEPPLGRFERLLTVLAGRVLERNETPFTPDQLSTTQSIDAALLDVSRSMPLSFWQVPSFHHLRPGAPDTLLETVRLAAHVYYYGLLIQLHLPYMMRVDDGAATQEYAKSTCINASREIMARFIAHRTFNPSSSCSRPVDFFALLAAMTLLLAHLDAHRHRDTPNVLAHQRLSDRAMLAQSLDRMDAIKNLNKDPVTAKSAAVIRRLMDMEADAARGGTYATSSAEEAGEEAEGLRLAIPYLGVVRISRQGPISRDPWTEKAATDESTLAASTSQSLPAPTNASLSDDQTLCPLAETPVAAWYGDQPTLLPCAGGGIDQMTPLTPTDFPPLVAGVDDWTFQGVDMAFFDSLMRGSTDSR